MALSVAQTNTHPVQNLVDAVLPHLLIAGRYAAKIQSRVGIQEEKGGDTIFHTALSDADLTIQSYFEVVLLSLSQDVAFYPEEYAKSLNVKYFNPESSLEVLLDPIDGTRSYIDGRQEFQVIIAIHDDAEMVGAIVHIPRRGVTYSAVKGQGARKYSNVDLESGTQGSVHVLPKVAPKGAPVLLFNSPELLNTISQARPAKDLLDVYREAPESHNSTDILEGLTPAIVYRHCQAIDGGAIAFIAMEAGAVWSDFNGAPVGSFRSSETRTLSGIVVSLSNEIHQELVAVLARQ